MSEIVFGVHHAMHSEEDRGNGPTCRACKRIHNKAIYDAIKAGTWTTGKKAKDQRFRRNRLIGTLTFSLKCNHKCGFVAKNVAELAAHKQEHATFRQPRETYSILQSSIRSGI